MSMRTLQTGFVLIVLALLSQGVAAALMPCDMEAAHDLTESVEQACHDEDADGHSAQIPLSDDGQDCAQQCACPAGPMTHSIAAALLDDLTDAGPVRPRLGTPPNSQFDAPFRPPIAG